MMTLVALAQQEWDEHQDQYLADKSHPCVVFVLRTLARWRPEVYVPLAQQATSLWWGQHASSEAIRHNALLKYAKLWGFMEVQTAIRGGDILLLSTKGQALDHVALVLDDTTHMAHLARYTKTYAVEPIIDHTVIRVVRR